MTHLIPQKAALFSAISLVLAALTGFVQAADIKGSLRLGDTVKYDLVEDGNFLKLIPRNDKEKIKIDHEFVYPGTITDPKTGTKIMESYAFVGDCLPNKPDSYVVYQIEHIEKKRKGRKLQTKEGQYFTATVSEQGIKEDQREIKRAGQLQKMLKETQKRTKDGKCVALSGKNRKMDPSVFNLRSRMNLEEPDDEEEENKATGTPKAIESKEESGEVGGESGGQSGGKSKVTQDKA